MTPRTSAIALFIAGAILCGVPGVLAVGVHGMSNAVAAGSDFTSLWRTSSGTASDLETATDACGGVCEGQTCGPLPCRIYPFYGTVQGNGICLVHADTGTCGCTPIECDRCGDGYVEGIEECDFGGTCAGGPDAGKQCTIGQCSPGSCEPRGGGGCAENCTNEEVLTRTVNSSPLQLSLDGHETAVSLNGSMMIAEGKAGLPQRPFCRPAAIRSFTPAPIVIPGVGCVCIEGAENPIAYGPGNVGAGMTGCETNPSTLLADLTLRVWTLPGGCTAGSGEDGQDGQPCTNDDPARQEASVVDADFGCSGDCNGDGIVDVTEILHAVNLALTGAAPYDCPSLDRNGIPTVTVDEIVAAVNNDLKDCNRLTIQ